MATWSNSDGLVVRFGRVTAETRKAAFGEPGGREREIVLDFDYTQAIAGIGANTTDRQYQFIPAGAVIRDVQLKVTTAWAGGGFTGLNIGTEQGDGTDIDADGFFASGSQGAAANLTPAGTVVGETTEINTVLSNTQDAYLLVAVVGSNPTAGAARLIVRYSY